LPVSKRATRGL